jgi:DNA-directed RNA polymerase specialized sigma24 family protein
LAEPLLTVEQAKEKVFEHWKQLNVLSRRRFPSDENLALEGLNYVLKKLEANDWQRVRVWEGHSDFLAFITTVTVRLLTDFRREKFSYIRKPVWLQVKNDPVWDLAYRLLVMENYSRQETLEMLRTSEPSRERWFFEEVVSTILEKCRQQTHLREKNLAIEELGEHPSAGLAPDEELINQDEENFKTLLHFLLVNADSDPPPAINKLLIRLKPYLHLTEEDRLILRLHYVDGLNIRAIAKLLNIKGDTYKHLNKIIRYIRKACQRVGLLNGAWSVDIKGDV